MKKVFSMLLVALFIGGITSCDTGFDEVKQDIEAPVDVSSSTDSDGPITPPPSGD